MCWCFNRRRRIIWSILYSMQTFRSNDSNCCIHNIYSFVTKVAASHYYLFNRLYFSFQIFQVWNISLDYVCEFTHKSKVTWIINLSVIIPNLIMNIMNLSSFVLTQLALHKSFITVNAQSQQSSVPLNPPPTLNNPFTNQPSPLPLQNISYKHRKKWIFLNSGLR